MGCHKQNTLALYLATASKISCQNRICHKPGYRNWGLTEYLNINNIKNMNQSSNKNVSKLKLDRNMLTKGLL
jgi:hypothetical protein